MASPPVSVYDFTSEENAKKWKGLLQPALSKIQKQVHPRMDIEDDAISCMEELVYHLLSQICNTQPHSINDVKAYVAKNFVVPINTWAINDAQRTMERHQVRRGKSVFNFPVEKLYPLLEKEVFNHTVEMNVVRYIAAILDYIAADILKLAGNFMKNTQNVAIRIKTSDIKLSLSADVALHSLFQRLHTQQPGEGALPPVEQVSEEASSYDQLVRQLMSNEEKYISHLSLILKVFQEPFTKRPDLFPPEEVHKVFVNLQELYGVSVQLLASLDDCMEMAGQVKGWGQCPQAGFVFEEVAESEDFDVYINYAGTYMEAVTVLENMLNKNTKAVEYLKTLTQPDLFKEAIQYVLPKSLLEPIYHCFYYFEAMNMLMKKSPSEEDQIAYESALGCMLGIKVELEKKCARFLPVRKEETGMFVQKPNYKTSMKKISNVQSKIEGWEGPDLGQFSTEFVMEGSLIMMREGGRKKTDRHVFLLDGLAVCCKPRQGGHEMYRLKEKINLRRVKLVDQQDDSDSADLKFSFQLIEPEQLAYTFFTPTKPDKNEWMSALTHMLTKSTFDRKLNMKLKEEEQEIRALRPHPDYPFAEEDMNENVLFDEREEGTFKSSNEALIKACTIHKLIERLTYHEYADPTLVRTFLMTYRSFCSPTKLLELLIERFNIPMSEEVDDLEAKKDPLMMKAVKAFKANYISPIQLRVFNVLRHWVDFHYYDFQRDKELLSRLHSFILTVKGKKMQKWVAALNRALEKKREEVPSATKPVFNRKPEKVEWWVALKQEDFNLLSLHPKEIARQLTLIMAENFRSIHPSELVDASWMKEKKKETASPNLLKHTRFETMISNWLTKEIVYTENFEERVALVSRQVDIMAEMRNLNNFAGMFAVNAAFQSASVFRLTHTLKKLEGRKIQLLDEVKQIASSERGYKNYKEKLRTINPPCVPFVGMYLSWIVFIRDGNEDQIPGMPDNFINFRKRRKIATVLQEIQQYQNTPYCIEPESSIQKYILSQDPQGDATPRQWEETLFEQSRSIEPKDQPPKRAPRKWRFDLKGPDQSFGFLTLQGRRQHRQKASQLSIDEDADLEAHKKSGSEPSSPSPSITSHQPPVPPKPKEPVNTPIDPDTPDLPPRASRPPPVLPPRQRANKEKLLVQSASCLGSFDQPPTPLLHDRHLHDRHRSPSVDAGLSSGNRYLHKKPPIPLHSSDRVHQRRSPPTPPLEECPPQYYPAENGGHQRSPPPLPSTPSPDISPTLLAGEERHLHEPAASPARGFGKSPAPPPPPATSSSCSTIAEYPPYDRLAPTQVDFPPYNTLAPMQVEFPPYDRLKPITVLPPPPLPSKPLPVDSVPPLPPRSTSDTQQHGDTAPPPLPPKVPPKGNQTNSLPPLPPKGSGR